MVLLQQMANIENSGFVRKREPQAKTRKAPQRLDFIQIVFQTRIAAIVRELQVIHPQHHRQGVRRPTKAAAR